MTQSVGQGITEKSSYVKLLYRVKTTGGKYLKGIYGPEFLEFITGYSHVIPGLEQRLVGHDIGEHMEFTVPAEEAFGKRHPELVAEKNRVDFHFPPGMQPWVGMELPIITGHPDGPDSVTITEIKGDTIVIDANHTLAGQDLHYELEIVEVRPARQDEVCAEWEESTHSDCSGGCGGVQTVVLGEDQSPEDTEKH